VELVRETGSLLSNIVSRVGEITGLIRNIAANAEIQADSLQQVNTAVGDMDRVTQQNAAMVEESTAASRSLADEARELSTIVGRFDVGKDHAAPIQTVSARPAAAPTQIRRAAPPRRRPRWPASRWFRATWPARPAPRPPQKPKTGRNSETSPPIADVAAPSGLIDKE
jgi:methyl-accepting chemotaxis protein